MAKDTIGNHILDAAGIHTTAARRSFRKENPDAEKLYKDTYHVVDDEALKEKFISSNKEEVAAALIASQRMAKDHPAFVKTPGTQVQNTTANAAFKEHYEAALKEIQTNQIDTSNPAQLAAFSKADLKPPKTPQAQVRTSSHTIEKPCKNLTCSLASYSLELSKTSDDSDFSVLAYKEKKRAAKIFDQLQTPETVLQDKGHTIDIFNSKTVPKVHLVAGSLNYFAAYLKVEAKGSCDHGYGVECPTVKIVCDHSKFDRTLGAGGTNSLEVPNTSGKLDKLRLYPRAVSRPSEDWRGYLNLLKERLDEPAVYNFSVRSHRSDAPYVGYYGLINVYRPIIMSFSAALKFSKEETFQTSFKARLDNEEIQSSASLSLQDGLSGLSSSNWLFKALGTVSRIARGFDALGDEEGRIDEAIDQDQDPECKAPEENEGWELQTVQLHLAYRRILKELDDKSGVDFKEEIYIAASPLLQIKTDVDVIKLLWRSCLDAATGGTWSVVSSLGVCQIAKDSFKNGYTFFREVARNIKNAVAIDDPEVKGVLCDDDRSGTQVSCVFSIGGAIETDNPGAGLVWKREPQGKWEWDRSSTSIYGGINASLEGKVTNDLRILKTLGFGAAIDTAGLKLELISADNTAPVRFAINMTADPNEKSRLQKEAKEKGQFNGASVEGDELAGVDGEVDPSSELACSFELLFSGVGLYIEAFIVVAKKSIEGENEDLGAESVQSQGRETKVVRKKKSTANTGTVKVKKRMSFQLMKARKSSAKTLRVPIDKIQLPSK